MRHFLGAALAALCLALPAAAQVPTIPNPQAALTHGGTGVSAWDRTTGGSILTSGDAVTAVVSGSSWATVRVAFGASSGAPSSTLYYSIDYGNNWLASGAGAPYAKLLSAAANPQTVALAATSTPANTWEFPLAGNVTNVKVAAGTTGITAQTVTITGGTPYVPGLPVVATLFDVKSAANTAVDTGVLDLSGWAGALVVYATPAGGSGKVYFVDDNGTSFIDGGALGSGGSPNMFIGAGVATVLEFGPSLPVTLTTGTLGGQGMLPAGPLPHRIDAYSAAVAALTSRIRVEVRR